MLKNKARQCEEQLSQMAAQLSQIQAQYSKLLQEKEWLMKEVHHRVKNNLQLVISLLNMQTGYMKDEFALDAFGDIGSRIRKQNPAIVISMSQQEDARICLT